MSLQTDIQLSHALAFKESSLGARPYLNHVVINSDPEPKQFRELAEYWQWNRCDYILPAVESVTGHTKSYTGPKNIWETMPRGHDKTSFIARLMNWVLVFSKRKNLRLLVAAKDSEQANILKDMMQTEAGLNPWFGKYLTFHQKIVLGPAGHLRIATADARGLFGHGIDIFVMEELTHWEDVLGQEVWTSLWSGRRKRPSAILLVLSNAGYLDTWQHKVYEQARVDRDWKLYEAPGIMASWMNREAIEKDKLLLPPAEARRLLDNQWVDLSEIGGYVTKREVLGCEEAALEMGLKWSYTLDRKQGYILSIDYGPKKDRTVITLGHQLPNSGLVAVDRMWIWEGKSYPDGIVPIDSIRDLIESVRAEAPFLWLVIDPYQMQELIQHYKNHLPVEVFEARGGKSNYEMAECLRTQIVQRKVVWPRGIGDIQVGEGAGAIVEGIPDELPRLILKKLAYGYRFDHTSGRHDDRACSLGMMCVCAFNRPKPANWVQRRKDHIYKKTPDLFRSRGSGRELYGVRAGDRA